MLSFKRIFLALSLPVAASSCSDFEEWKVMHSGSGIYAKISLPVSKDAFAVCLSSDAREKCSRRRAIYYGYRSDGWDVRWLSANHLLILQTGGEVWKQPEANKVTVKGRPVTITTRYFSQ
jgi:hypothetical protein